ncbi:MAG: HlyD family efflux transporter periplasmic adaptor subunit [Acidimicrobiales bacterium]
MTERTPRARRRWGWAAAALCAIGGATGAVVAETVGSAVMTYRTADATDASVRSLLTVPGTVDPARRSTAAFEVSGTVASVAVHVGQQVTAGETLATLEPTSLEKEETTAKTNLSAAEATLAADESVQSSDADPPSANAADPKTTTSTSSGANSTASVAAAQHAVVQAQAAADAQAQTAAAELGHARAACSKSTTGSRGTGGGTETGATETEPGAIVTAGIGTGAASSARATGIDKAGSKYSGGTTSGETARSTATSADAGRTRGGTSTKPSGLSATEACTTSLTAALDAENLLTTHQKAVTQAENALARLMATSTPSGSSPSGADRSDTGNTGTRTSDTGALTDSTANDSPAQLATDQSTIDSDEAALIDAKQSLTESTLTSPIAGTVALVDLAVGEGVDAGSTTDVVTVVDQESYEAIGSLTSSDAQQEKVGDTAIVSVDGDDHDVTGVVTRVGPVDVASGNTYPVVVALSGDAADVFPGTSARIKVVVERAGDVLSVPTSSVHTDGAGHSYVLTLEHGTEMRTTVQVGVVGAVYTQIVSGLRKGEPVVVADLTKPVPTPSNTFSSTDGSGTIR